MTTRQAARLVDSLLAAPRTGGWGAPARAGATGCAAAAQGRRPAPHAGRVRAPVHPVLQRALERWEASGWEEYMGRKPTRDDLIVPRPDGTQRLVSTSYKQFMADLAAVGIDAQRQYESRATFRNLALSAGVPKYQVDLITHPKPTQGPDFYNRLDMLWTGLCEAVSAIGPGAWGLTPPSLTPPSPPERVTAEVTVRVTGAARQNDKPPTSLKNVGGKMEREKGFEPQIDPGFSRTYDTIDGDNRGSTERLDASRRVPSSPMRMTSGKPRPPCPNRRRRCSSPRGRSSATEAGAAEPSTVQGILRRAMDQAAAPSAGRLPDDERHLTTSRPSRLSSVPS